MRVLVFGTGYQYRKRKEQLDNMTVLAFLDNSKEKQGNYLNGIFVDRPENVHHYIYDYVLLFSDYYPEMRAQLLELKVPAEKIIDEEHPGNFGLWFSVSIKKYKIAKVTSQKKKKILLYSHEMSLTGAPRALFNMACVLKQAGYYVEVYSRIEGKLIYEFLQESIPVTVINRNSQYYLDVEEVTAIFDLIVMNTICCCDLVNALSGTRVPVVWWLHESETMYNALNVTDRVFIPANNVHVYGVGYKAVAAYKKIFKENRIEELLYGVKEYMKGMAEKEADNKIIFALIGSEDFNKGHDILLKALYANIDLWKDKVEIWLVGQLSNETKNKFNELGISKVWGQLEYESVMNLYEKIDVVICASYFETMSTVITEGMMKKKACIVSDGAGNANYIENFKSGVLFRSGNAESLSEAIKWVINHPEELKKLGEHGYEIYQKYFSQEHFKKHVIEIAEQLI